MRSSIFKKSPILNWVKRILKSASTRNSIAESLRRKELDIFDFLNLAQPLSINYSYLVSENNLYGNGRIFNQIKGFNPTFVSIEHGFIFGSLVQENTIQGWQKTVFTFSDYRRNYIEKKTNKDVVCIGPYIHYFDNILDPLVFSKLKEELGRVLLVFPSHSIQDTNISYNREQFKACIADKAQDYDTVLICLYWADILKGEYKLYQQDKYHIVTSGHIFDLYFLNRLRTFFELSDYVLTNSIGTHIGYASYFEKPIYIFKQEIIISGDQNSNELSQRDGKAVETLKQTLLEIYNLFSDPEVKSLRSDQYEYISQLFGFKYLRK